MIDLKALAKAGVHFGHQRMRWNPKMKYIWGHRNGIHLIDVSQTARHLERAAQFLKQTALEGKTILWVGTKKPARAIIQEAANRLGMPYVTHRWIGGTLSNFSEVKKSITRMLHYQDVVERAEKFPHYTKKELNMFKKVVDRAQKNVGGIVELSWPIGAVVLVDAGKERSALREANRMGVPVVALVDTNTDPSMVDYVIPGNDDAPRSIKIIIDYLADATESGLTEAKKIKAAKLEARKKDSKKVVATAAAAKKVETKKPSDSSVKAAGSKEKVASKVSPKKVVTKKKDAPAAAKVEAKAVEKKAPVKAEAKVANEKVAAKKKEDKK